MKELIKTVKDFKIIPSNFKSAAKFELIEIGNNSCKALLKLTDDSEMDDYKENSSVEVFGVNNVGLVYFETKILKSDADKKVIELALVDDYSIIQRREYSRVELNSGNVEFCDLGEGFIKKVEDISAGGLKFVASAPLETDKQYAIKIILSSNMKIDCAFIPIRVDKLESCEDYLISGKFEDLENMDRITLVQYTFKIKMEKQNKESDLP